ncbi:MAG: hypothetical protein IT381_14185 [Deltaproteobacteria bacterium]|nr:hypothetical protein [Deltaproteobacteria bacterium]
MGEQQRASSYRNDPAWVFTLRVAGGCQGESPIVIRAFEVFDHPDRTRDYLTVEVRQGGSVIFERGQLWTGSPVRGWRDGLDGHAARDAVLSLVAMAPGDTDPEFFESYSDEQRAWAVEHGQWLTLERERRYAE